MQIDQKTIAEILHLGGQYFVPIAALLRALYSGIRGKYPQGMAQIIVASFFAGVTAVIGQDDLNIRAVALQKLCNSGFMAGVFCSFIWSFLCPPPPDRAPFLVVFGAALPPRFCLSCFFSWKKCA